MLESFDPFFSCLLYAVDFTLEELQSLRVKQRCPFRDQQHNGEFIFLHHIKLHENNSYATYQKHTYLYFVFTLVQESFPSLHLKSSYQLLWMPLE